jgi:hypothetical protein
VSLRGGEASLNLLPLPGGKGVMRIGELVITTLAIITFLFSILLSA